MVVFDSTYLIDLFNDKLGGDQRIALDGLIDNLTRNRTRVLIPAPCMTELLVHAGAAATDYNERLNRKHGLRGHSVRPARSDRLRLVAGRGMGQKAAAQSHAHQVQVRLDDPWPAPRRVGWGPSIQMTPTSQPVRARWESV